jgi:UDP-glucose 4-epimerase
LRALVTGSKGNIGSLLVNALHEAGYFVYGLSRHALEDSSGAIKAVQPNEIVTAISELPNIDLVFHLASQTSAYRAKLDVAEDLSSNVFYFIQVLEGLRKGGHHPVVIMAGSITEFGRDPQLPLNEECIVKPETFYEIGKVMTQIYGSQYEREGWIQQFLSIRLPNIYGNISTEIGKDRGFIDQCIRKSLLGEDLIYFGTGEYIRDFLHVSDAVRAFLAASFNHKKLVLDAYNIGSGRGINLFDALNTVRSLSKSFTSKSSSIKQEVFPEYLYEIEKRHAIVDAETFTRLTGWKPEITFEEGIILAMKALTQPK